MAKKGRKRIYDDPLEPCNIGLTPYQRRKARRIGKGEMGRGVRKALDDAPMPDENYSGRKVDSSAK